MSFWLRKVAADLILPGGWLLGLGLLGTVLYLWPRRRFRRAGTLIWISGALLLYALSTQPVSQSFLIPLETTHPVPAEERLRQAEATVVLSGGLWPSPLDPAQRGLSRISLSRTVAGATLHRRLRTRWLVFSGGSGDPLSPELEESVPMRALAVEMGVPADEILLESSSRSTGESARALGRLLREQGVRRVLLVTSAFHLPRSVRLLRREGFDVIPYPSDFSSRPRSYQLRAFIPGLRRLEAVDIAVHEYAALLADSLER